MQQNKYFFRAVKSDHRILARLEMSHFNTITRGALFSQCREHIKMIICVLYRPRRGGGSPLCRREVGGKMFCGLADTEMLLRGPSYLLFPITNQPASRPALYSWHKRCSYLIFVYGFHRVLAPLPSTGAAPAPFIDLHTIKQYKSTSGNEIFSPYTTGMCWMELHYLSAFITCFLKQG